MKKTYLTMKIQPTVLLLFIFLSLLIMIITFFLQYYFLKDLALNATEDNIKHISSETKQKINTLDNKTYEIISTLEYSKKIDVISKENEKHDLLPLITNMLNHNEFIYAIYVGNKNGEFYEVINLDIEKSLRDKYEASSDIKWLVIKIYNENNKRIEVQEYLDSNLNLKHQKKIDASYNPSTRPWFLEAKEETNVIKTDPYLYSNLEAYGITYAKKLMDSTSVIGVDVSLESLSLFLEKQLKMENSEAYIFKKDGVITSGASLNKNFIKNTDYKDNKKNIVPYYDLLDLDVLKEKKVSYKLQTIEGEKYYSYLTKLDSFYKSEEYLSILLPLDLIMRPYNQKILFSSTITFLVLLCILPIVWFATRLLVIPIENLAKENFKVSELKFDDVKPVTTYIKEIDELSISLVTLSKSIKKHQDAEKKLMDSFIKIIASAIDAKSKYTGGHCERVPVLSMMIAKEASLNKDVFKDFTIENEEEERELNVAAWLHDCGKVTTPEYVVDKATKLETIYNRIHEIRTRFEVLHRDLTIKSLENILKGANKNEEEAILKLAHKKLHDDYALLAEANIGCEYMPDDLEKEIKRLANITWTRYFDNSIGISRDEQKRLARNEKNTTPSKEYLLSNRLEHIIKRENYLNGEYDNYDFKLEVPEDLYNLGEVYNLLIKKGTLTKEERFKINEHSIMSIIMLEELPFLENLMRVPEYATCHHETLIGTGYPRALKKEDMSLPARFIALADVFEALTSSDRPYKEAKTLSESINILDQMVKDKHLDEDIFRLFLETGIYKSYAKDYLIKEQIDEVDISKYI